MHAALVAIIPKIDFLYMYSKRYSSITFEELQPFFVMDEVTASQEFGYSLSTFKKTCQNLGIKMWPYRQIQYNKCIQVSEFN